MTHADLLKRLLPPSSYDIAGAGISAELTAEGVQLDQVAAMVGALLDEADPGATNQLLTDWERVAGLPGDCGTLGETLQQRRRAVVAQLTSLGGQSKQYFIELASTLGYQVTISEYRPFLAGISQAGDELSNGDWKYRWMVRAPEVTTFDFKAGLSVAGEPLRAWGVEGLECPIRTRKPAHTEVTFTYGQ